MVCLVFENEGEDNTDGNGQYIPNMSMSTVMSRSLSPLMKKNSSFGKGGVMVTNQDMSNEQGVRA